MDVDKWQRGDLFADAPRGCRHSCRLTLWSIGRLISLFPPVLFSSSTLSARNLANTTASSICCLSSPRFVHKRCIRILAFACLVVHDCRIANITRHPQLFE